MCMQTSKVRVSSHCSTFSFLQLALFCVLICLTLSAPLLQRCLDLSCCSFLESLSKNSSAFKID